MSLLSIVVAAAAAASSPPAMHPPSSLVGPHAAPVKLPREKPTWLLPLPPIAHGVGGGPLDYRAKQMEFGPGEHRFALAYVRQRQGPAHDRWGLDAPRLPSSWRAIAAYRIGSESGSLAIEAMGGSDRRKPPALLGDGHWQSVRRGELDMAWRPESRLRIAGGWKGISDSNTRGSLERQILLASGAPLAENGPHLSFDLDAPHDTRRAWRLGLDVGSFAVATSDRTALGLSGARDARASLSFRLNIR